MEFAGGDEVREILLVRPQHADYPKSTIAVDALRKILCIAGIKHPIEENWLKTHGVDKMPFKALACLLIRQLQLQVVALVYIRTAAKWAGHRNWFAVDPLPFCA